MPLNARIEKLPEGRAVVVLDGPMTLGSSLKLADTQIQTVIADGATRIVIDLTGVDYVDSAGLGMLVFTYGSLNEKGGSLRLCGVAARVMSLLKLTKTDTFLAIDKDRDESVTALGL
ncbi:MAG: STAS domain-containing protein [Terracidiphilus sp.]|jgi:anti-sigma B factor antagonist